MTIKTLSDLFDKFADAFYARLTNQIPIALDVDQNANKEVHITHCLIQHNFYEISIVFLQYVTANSITDLNLLEKYNNLFQIIDHTNLDERQKKAICEIETLRNTLVSQNSTINNLLSVIFPYGFDALHVNKKISILTEEDKLHLITILKHFIEHKLMNSALLEEVVCAIPLIHAESILVFLFSFDFQDFKLLGTTIQQIFLTKIYTSTAFRKYIRTEFCLLNKYFEGKSIPEDDKEECQQLHALCQQIHSLQLLSSRLTKKFIAHYVAAFLEPYIKGTIPKNELPHRKPLYISLENEIQIDSILSPQEAQEVAIRVYIFESIKGFFIRKDTIQTNKVIEQTFNHSPPQGNGKLDRIYDLSNEEQSLLLEKIKEALSHDFPEYVKKNNEELKNKFLEQYDLYIKNRWASSISWQLALSPVACNTNQAPKDRLQGDEDLNGFSDMEIDTPKPDKATINQTTNSQKNDTNYFICPPKTEAELHQNIALQLKSWRENYKTSLQDCEDHFTESLLKKIDDSIDTINNAQDKECSSSALIDLAQTLEKIHFDKNCPFQQEGVTLIEDLLNALFSSEAI